MSQHQPRIQPNRNGQLEAEVPDPEVVPRAKRRQFSAQYKLQILTEATNAASGVRLGPCYDEKACTHLT
jgi:hypothetical protein